MSKQAPDYGLDAPGAVYAMFVLGLASLANREIRRLVPTNYRKGAFLRFRQTSE